MTVNSKYMHECCVVDSLGVSTVRDIVGSLLLRHICQLVSNAHAITAVMRTNAASSVSSDGVVCSAELRSRTSTGDRVVESVDMCQQVRVATAVYPTVSLMNHSCDPSIIARSH